MEAGREKEARSPAILARLFPAGHRCEVRRGVITGRAVCAGREIAVIGTTNHTTIDIPMSLRLSAHVLATVESAPGMPIVMLVDCAGQQLSREAELLGINGYFAHLLKCLHHARASGHHLVSVVYGKALSGAFLSFGLMGDQVYGITGSEVGVMKLSAMARVTKISERQLRRLGETSAVFAPGMENFMRLGGNQEIWTAEGEVEDRLAAALRVADRDDRRRALGAERGGRTLARMVAEKVKADVAREMSR
ncbi:MAG: biotin-independent malonate decarboxylase subunit gamma [Candidatus Aureabacteria bacterium]|nr:biotin-independent malonate decarboxylase subunit gamma [Candidatus Auribacterota bacterium]